MRFRRHGYKIPVKIRIAVQRDDDAQFGAAFALTIWTYLAPTWRKEC